MCRATRTEPSLLLHPLDFMGLEDKTGLEFFPAMSMPVNKKLELMDGFFTLLQKSFEPVPIGEFVASIDNRHELTQYKASFTQDQEAA